jgi:tRNA (cytidine/uridine-2'-O-)-methyltransferase
VFHIVLVEPEIPPNTGNVLRLASNTGARLHLVRPLGFTLDDRRLVRAGLDYGDLSGVTVHDDWNVCLAHFATHRASYISLPCGAGEGWGGGGSTDLSPRLFAVTKRGSQRFDAPRYRADDIFVFGSETRGLPETVMDACEQRIRVPMRAGNRSLNLSNTVAVVIYEAWRQQGYAGAS